MSEQINDIRKRHEIETRYETFECRDTNNAVNQLVWRLGDKHLNPLVNSDRAYLLNRIAELEAERLKIEANADYHADKNDELMGQVEALQAKLDELQYG
jgi:flagellar biosynthesis/type III secretory pathway chaperone